MNLQCTVEVASRLVVMGASAKCVDEWKWFKVGKPLVVQRYVHSYSVFNTASATVPSSNAIVLLCTGTSENNKQFTYGGRKTVNIPTETINNLLTDEIS